MGLGKWLKDFFDKVKSFIKRGFNLGKPFVKEFLGETAQLLWQNGQALLMDAVAYVAAQGLPTTEAKQKAFKDYMQERSEIAIDKIKENDFATVRNMALAIWKKSQEQNP